MIALTPARWLLIGEWRAHPGRLIIAVLAIAVGVALGFAVHLVNQTALDSFGRALRSVNGGADLQVHAATATGFDEGLYPQIAGVAGVASTSPVIELAASSGTIAPPGTRSNGGSRFTLLGLDLLRAAVVTPGLLPSAAPGVDSVFLSGPALIALNRHIGQRLTIDAAGRSHTFTISGTIPGADDTALAIIDIADAQWRFGQLGRLQRLDLRLAPGADPAVVSTALAAILPVGGSIETPASAAGRTDSLSRAYRVNLEMLAMVALLTGGFLVYSAQSLAVARRAPHFALLRVLGLKASALTGQVVAEGALLGVAGAAFGLALGYGLAVLTLRLLGGDLGSGMLRDAAPELHFSLPAAIAFGGIGIVVAMASSLVPARAAARARPAITLKSSDNAGDQRPDAQLGVTVIIIGGIAALGPPLWGLPLLGYAAMALLLAGGIAIMPWVARALLGLVPARRLAPPLDLALKRLRGAPGQAAVALCGIVASTALMVAMAVMVTSFRGSVDSWLTQILPSDIYLHLEGADAGGLDAAAQARLAATPGIVSMRFVRQMPLRLAADKPPVLLSGQPIDAGNPAAHLAMIGGTVAVPVGATPVWVSEPMGWLYGLKPGDQISLPLGGAARPVFVAGVWRDYARQFGAIAMRDTDLARLTGDATKTEAAIDVAPRADIPRSIAALRQRLPVAVAGQAMFGQPRQMRAMALTIFDRSFAITYALEAIAIIIGLIGIAATFSAQVLARTREFGMLRHIGVTRRQIMTMLAAEGALLGTVGSIAGITLGVVMSQVLIDVINPQSFHWTMDTSLPWGLLGLLAVALVAAAAGTAVLAGRQAVSAHAVRAVRDDW